MKIIHIISVGKNGGENIYQKYLNYYNSYKKLSVDYELIVIAPESVNETCFNAENTTVLKIYTSQEKCILKRIWINALPKLENLLNSNTYDFLILRMDFIDNGLFKFIQKYQPILEYPTPPIEKTMQDRHFYHLLANKYNPYALKASKLNMTVIDVGYENSYIFHNSLHDQHRKKTKFLISDTINILLMSSKYGANEYNGYDRLLSGLEKYIKKNKAFNFVLYVAGKDVDGFKSMLNPFLEKNLTIHYLGFQTIPQLNEIVYKIDIGINDLAFHRRSLNVANTLKTLDFLGWNIPFMLSHSDVNIDKKHNYFMEVPQNEEPIDIDAMISFLRNINQDTIEQMKLQAENISLEKRAASFVDFLGRVNDV